MDRLDAAAILSRLASAPPTPSHGHTLEELNHAHPLAEYFAQQRAHPHH